MKIEEAYIILKKHQQWRRCRCDKENCDCKPPTSPADLDLAIDVILNYLAVRLDRAAGNNG